MIVLEGLVEMDLVKVSGAVKWLILQNKKGVQSFIAFVNFYQRFIKNLSHHAPSLFKLTKKGVRWKWGEMEQAVFDKLRQLITSTPVLIFPDDSHPYCVEADSSDAATGAFLSQQSSEEGRKWHLVVFFKSLSPVKWKYEIHDKDMLVIIHAPEEWWHYLRGAPCWFEVWMDHKNLKYFHMSKKLDQWQAWCSLHLSWFDFTLHHLPGCSMGKSDTLFHCADHGSGSGDNGDMTMLPPGLFASSALEGVTATRVEAEVL